MKAFRVPHLELAVAFALFVGTVEAAEVTGSKESKPEQPPRTVYQVALINKSMTGDWRDERQFKKHVKDLFGVSEILKFKLRTDAFQDWLDEQKPSTAKVICLVDGWVDPGMARVDVRGTRQGKPLRFTRKVEDGDWKAALARAKEYAEGDLE